MDQRVHLASQRRNIQSLLLPQTTQILDRSRLNIIKFTEPPFMCLNNFLVKKCEALKSRVNDDHIVISSTVPNMRSNSRLSLQKKAWIHADILWRFALYLDNRPSLQLHLLRSHLPKPKPKLKPKPRSEIAGRAKLTILVLVAHFNYPSTNLTNC